MSLKKIYINPTDWSSGYCWNACKIRFLYQRIQSALRRAGCSTVSPCHSSAQLVTIQLPLPAWGVLVVTQVLCWHRDTTCDIECDTECGGSSTGGSLTQALDMSPVWAETSTGTGSSSCWAGSSGTGERTGRALGAFPSPLELGEVAHPLSDPGWLWAGGWGSVFGDTAKAASAGLQP